MSFIVFPLKFGGNYYSLIRNVVYIFHPKIGYVLKNQLLYSNPTSPPDNAPRKVHFVEVCTNDQGFLTKIKSEDFSKFNKIIFCIGGSTTVGWESHYNKTYPVLLDNLIKPNGYRCINAGVGGYRSIHELLLFKHKIMRYNPYAIILFSGYNDFISYYYRVSKPFNPHAHFNGEWLQKNYFDEVARYSSLLYLMKKKVIQFYKMEFRTPNTNSLLINNAKDALLNKNNWLDEWIINITDIFNLCKTNGIKVFFLSHIHPMFINATPEAKKYADKDIGMDGMFDALVKFHKILREESINLCLKNNMTFLDIAADFEKLNSKFSGPDYYKNRFSWFTDRVHITEKGNEFIANSIYNKIKNTL